jgi:hypothetical protein
MKSVVSPSSLAVGKTAAPGETVTVSDAARSIVALTACVTAVTGMPVLSFFPAVISALSITGVFLARRFPRQARHLMWFGAAVTSLWAIPFGAAILRISLTGGTDPKVIIAIATSISLVVACDTALITEALSERRTTDDERRS